MFPDAIHFFSYGTKVSLELPVGWEEQSQEDNTAVYVYEAEDDEDYEFDPRLIVTAVSLPTAGPDGFRSLAASLATVDRASAVVESQADTTVDGQQATEHILTYVDEAVGAPVLHHQVVTQIDDIGFAVVGIAPVARRDDYLETFRDAAASIRFVLVT